MFPLSLDNVRRREVTLRTYSERGIENSRQAQDELFTYQNTRKARLGGLEGLQNPLVMDPKREAEHDLRQQVADDPKLREKYGDAWDQVATAIELWEHVYHEYYVLERGMAFNTELFMIARGLLRMAEETAKPNGERLREYAEAGLDSLKQQLFSEAPIYAELETVKLADSLSFLMELVGANNDLVKQVMAGKSPSDRAAELVAGSRLADVKYRQDLAAMSLDALSRQRRSDDPSGDSGRRARANLRKIYDEKIDEPMRQAYGKIAQVGFQLEGQDTYPDATFTLRLAFGQVKGYNDLGEQLPPWTTIGGAFEHSASHAHKEPFELPESWRQRKSQLDLQDAVQFRQHG